MQRLLSLGLGGVVCLGALLGGAPLSGQIVLPTVLTVNDYSSVPPDAIDDQTLVFDLRLADTGTWNQLDPAGDGPEDGVFDPDLRLVIYKFTELVFPEPPMGETRTYTFVNHYTRCPVVFLINGNFELPAGVTLSLDGEEAKDRSATPLIPTPGAPGPGGFRGGYSGRSTGELPGSGLGVGGGGGTLNPGVAVTSWPGKSNYIPSSGIPLVGGSGGVGSIWHGSSSRLWSGGAGGGAILIAVAGSALMDGVISARGGNGSNGTQQWAGPGSGGCIRLAANSVAGSGGFNVRGGAGAPGVGCPPGEDGRIRVEVSDPVNFPGSSIVFEGPSSVVGPANDSLGELKLWPTDTDPYIRIRSIAGLTTPSFSTGSLVSPDLEIPTPLANMVVEIETSGFDALTSDVVLRIGKKHITSLTGSTGGPFYYTATSPSGQSGGFDIWTFNVSVPTGYTIFQAHAVMNP